MSFSTDIQVIDQIIDDWKTETGQGDLNVEVGTLDLKVRLQLPIMLMDYEYQYDESLNGYPILPTMQWTFTYLRDTKDYADVNVKLEKFLNQFENNNKEVLVVAKQLIPVTDTRLAIGWMVTVR